jgi:hypothetical protein
LADLPRAVRGTVVSVEEVPYLEADWNGAPETATTVAVAPPTCGACGSVVEVLPSRAPSEYSTRHAYGCPKGLEQ